MLDKLAMAVFVLVAANSEAPHGLKFATSQ